MTGLAQKGGAVMSHVRIAGRQEALHAARIATGEAHLVLGCDLVVAVGEDALSKMRVGVTHALVNTGQAITGDFVRNPDLPFPLDPMKEQLREAVGADGADFVDACAPGRAADGPFDRHQHLHARLRLAEGPGAGIGRGARCARSN